MWKRLFYKWFGLSEDTCPVCEVLREQLAMSERERRELLQRALSPPPSEPLVKESEHPIPITPAFTPWRVRQQMLEAEDRKRAELLRRNAEDVEKLEKELGVAQE